MRAPDRGDSGHGRIAAHQMGIDRGPHNQEAVRNHPQRRYVGLMSL